MKYITYMYNPDKNKLQSFSFLFMNFDALKKEKSQNLKSNHIDFLNLTMKKSQQERDFFQRHKSDNFLINSTFKHEKKKITTFQPRERGMSCPILKLNIVFFHWVQKRSWIKILNKAMTEIYSYLDCECKQYISI